MASLVVVDSNVILGRLLPVSYSTKARHLVEEWAAQGVRLAAPLLFRYEAVAVMRRYVHQKLITYEEAVPRLEKVFRTAIDYYFDQELLDRAFELASQFNRPTAYDAQYLAVAERLGCDLWTADEKLFNAVNHQLGWVRWLGNFTPSES